MQLRLLFFSILFVALASAVLAEAPAAEGRGETSALAAQLCALSPRVRPKEAARVAQCAETTHRALARRYRAVGPAVFHNFLVNSGIRQRGLCYQWTEDLLA